MGAAKIGEHGGRGLREWQARPAAQRLRVTVGSTVDGQPVEVDLKPPPLGGLGAHGLLTGIAAGARTELLHALLCGLLDTHAPETVQLCLVDGEQAELFRDYQRAQHAVREPRSPALLIEALAATSAQRRRLLRTHGMRTLHDYDRARHYQPELPPIVPLVLVLHRLSLLHRESPELTELLRGHCAAWRDHGVHLLLVEDRLADVPAALDGYFGFELAVSDRAAELRVPGREPVGFTPPAAPDVQALVATMPKVTEGSFLPRETIDFTNLVELRQTEEHGLRAVRETIALPVGELLGADRGEPFRVMVEQGQVLLVGTGLAWALSGFALSIALHRTPAQARLYLLDLNGSSLPELAGGLPHVRVAVSGADDSLRDKTRDELAGLVKHREQLYHRLPDLTDRAEAGEPAAIFVLVHGWPDAELHPGLAAVLRQLVLRGQAVGVHVLLGLDRWADLEPALHGAFRHRLELPLADPDSSPLPGRPPELGSTHGRTGDGTLFMLAGPRHQARDLAPDLAAAWPHPVQRLKALPYKLNFADIGGGDRDFKLGVTEGSGLPFTFQHRHLLCFGDPESGKSTLIRSFIRGLVALRTPEEARVVGVDYGRTWFNADCEGLLISYVRTATQFDEAVRDIGTALAPRRNHEGQWRGPDLYLVIDDYDYLAAAQRDQLAPLVADAAKTGFHLVIAGRYPAKPDPVLRGLELKDTTVLSLSGADRHVTPVSGARPRVLPPGRAITRRWTAEETVQLTWTV
ncbi:FtsK/SpoIIIE domain-containing protein [Crossiella sp. NPDC003009]